MKEANKVKETKVSSLVPDDKNFNRGTQHGQRMLEKSLRELGAGRSVLIDKNNRIIAGNKTVEEAASIGLEDVIVVETDGSKLVAVKRTDVDLDSQQGRELALADNAVGMADLDFDTDLIAQVSEEFDFNPEDWGVEMVNKLVEEANAMIGQASSAEAISSYSDDTNYDLNNFMRSGLNQDIQNKIDEGINQGTIRREIAEILEIRAKQCTVFNFDELTKFYRSNDATEVERELLQRLYLVFVAPKELFEKHILRLNDVAKRIYDDELMNSSDDEE